MFAIAARKRDFDCGREAVRELLEEWRNAQCALEKRKRLLQR